MRIGVLVLMAGRSAGGPETYEIELLRALARRDTEHQYIIYCTTPRAIEAIGVTAANFSYRVLTGGRAWALGVRLPALLARDRIDVLHSTFTPPPRVPVREVLTVHCLSSVTHPEFYAPVIAWRLNGLLRLGIRRATRILCVSEATRDDVQRQFGVAAERLAVAYNGVGPAFAPHSPHEARAAVAAALGVDQPFILFLGKLEPRKNVTRLVEAYARFRASTGSSARLLLCGARTRVSPDLDSQIAALDLNDWIIRPGYVAPELVPHLYAAARFFVFPSLWEGFGIPVVEAMASGIPVVTSNVSCLPEVAGDAAIIVEPDSIESIAGGMARLETSSSLRRALSERGLARAKRFSWNASAEVTLQAYEQAASRPP